MIQRKSKPMIYLYVGLGVALGLFIAVYSYLHSPGFYLNRENHWQHQKQEALKELELSENKIQYRRSKRNAIQNKGLDYLEGTKEGATSLKTEYTDMNQAEGD